MKKIITFYIVILFAVTAVYGGGHKVGDKASDFSLKNVDGKQVSLKDYPDAKGFVIVFTCNSCPYARAYEDRLIEIDGKFREKGIPVIAINPNDPEVSPGDSFDKMIERAEEKRFTFPYLFDETQEVFKAYGASRTPHVFVLKKTGKGNIVTYIGAIDNNYEDASAVTEPYLEDALEDLLAGKKPEINQTKAIGCSIKVKR